MKIKHLIESLPDAAALSVSSKTTVGAGGAGILLSMTEWNWAAIIASAVAIVGLAINFYFLRRRDRREHTEHAARMAELRDRCRP